jgi:formate/nitrite transporter
LAETVIETGATKAELSAAKIVIRGMLGGAFLAYGTAMAFYGASQGMIPILAAALFPLGFIIINILQVDLATGYFAYVPLAWLDRRISFGDLARSTTFVYLGNLLGSLVVAGLLWAAITSFGTAPDATATNGQPGIAAIAKKTGEFKTLHYIQQGPVGEITLFVKGILCNWFVTLGVILPMATRSAFGKAILTFVPIYMFFGMGWEHLVVNMFIMPSAMLYGSHITWTQWWVGNELPVTIGNFVGGFLLTGATIGWIYYKRRPEQEEALAAATVAPATLT